MHMSDWSSDVCSSDLGRAVLFALGEPFEIAGQEIEIGASVGVALRPRHGTSLTELMRAADAAMYQAKGHGRGRVEQFSEAPANQLADRAQTEIDLRSAIERDQFAPAHIRRAACRERGSTYGWSWVVGASLKTKKN